MHPVSISSFEDYLEKTEHYKGANLFRGQANQNWSIIPKLFREINPIQEEARIIREIINSPSPMETLFEKQHYGSSTRLIDLTISPLSALFFAIDDKQESSNDGVVYVFSRETEISVRDARINAFLETLANVPIENIPDPLHEFSTNNHIIKYEPNLAYTNKRATLQGGTALLVGLQYENAAYSRVHNPEINANVVCCLKIPASLKETFRSKLSILGYDRNILYNDFIHYETTADFALNRTYFEVFHKGDFEKIRFHYKVSLINYDKDTLALKINSLYNELFQEYGENSRIFGSFYFDDTDKTSPNWICQTRWSSSSRLNINWTRDYYQNRLIRLNEEVSTDLLFSKITPVLEPAKELLSRIIAYSKNELSEVLEFYRNQRNFSASLVIAVTDTPYSAVGFEELVSNSIGFVSNIDQIIIDMLIFAERNETEKFLKYWNQVLIKDAVKYAMKLNETYKAEFWEIQV